MIEVSFLSASNFYINYKSGQVYSAGLSSNKGFIWFSHPPSSALPYRIPFSPLSLVNSSLCSCIEPSNDATYYHRSMRTFNFTVLAVLSSIAMVGAIPIGHDAPTGTIARRQLYVP